MTEAINYWILQTLAMGATALLIPRLRITSLFGAFKIVAALAFLNATVWDAALFFSIPEGLTSQTIVLFGVNGAIFWILVKVLDGIEVDGFLPALIAPVVFTALSLMIDRYGHTIDWKAVFDTVISAITSLREELGGAAAIEGLGAPSEPGTGP